MLTINDHLLSSAKQIPSVNCCERPDGAVIDLLVIHNISLPPGQYGGTHVDNLFSNCLDPAAHPYFKSIAALKVSAHLFVQRSGRITQYVPFNKSAWHAGESSFDGQENCNDFSIGIELEGTDTEEYSEEQYRQLINISNVLIKYYPKITSKRIVGHCDIAPTRKTDPGIAFKWRKYRAGLVGFVE